MTPEYSLNSATTMKSAALLFLFVAVASAVCSSHATSVASPHIIGGKLWENPIRPAVFDLNLYKNNVLVRTCKATELVVDRVFCRWITAAECLDSKKYDKIEVKYNILGEFHESKFDLGTNSYRIHPEYNNVTGENNIGLIIPLIHYINKDSSLRRIELPTAGEKFQGKAAHVFLEYKNTTKKHDDKESMAIKAVQTKVISNKWCAFWYLLSPIRGKNVCASGWYWKGLSKNDIGIPLIVREDDDNFKLVGIATGVRSWVHWLGLPIEFLDVQPYLGWILSVE